MGQRLIIKVYEDKNSMDEYRKGAICSIYYHWSAYSISALYEAKNLVEAIRDELEEGKAPRQIITSKVDGFTKESNMRFNLPNYNVANFLQQKDSNIKLTDDDKESLIDFLIRVVEKLGIRVDEDDHKNMTELYPNIKFSQENLNRSTGLIAFTEEAQKSQMDWCEGLVEIYLREQEINSDVYFFAEGKEELKEELHQMDEMMTEEDIDEIIKNIKELQYSPAEMTYDTIGLVIKELDENTKTEFCWLKYKNDYIYLIV